MTVQPEFPIYVPSKGRADSRLTAKMLLEWQVPFQVIVEAQEYDSYAAVLDPKHLLVLDPAYQRDYDTCDDLGTTKSKGPGPARNFAWDHAIARGAKRHWVMDDNIRFFYRLHQNRKFRFSDATAVVCMEDFVERYTNVAMAGPNYDYFAPRKVKVAPFVMNTRIYSCNLILNAAPFRWRGRYNEDTDLSLQMLKARWCTMQFNAFLQRKVPTQILKGGNTDAFYAKEGTLAKSQMQVKLHPDVSRLVWRYGRHHHFVDYSPFKHNVLIQRKDIEIPTGTDEYGLKLIPHVKPGAAAVR